MVTSPMCRDRLEFMVPFCGRMKLFPRTAQNRSRVFALSQLTSVENRDGNCGGNPQQESPTRTGR
jgi:hypothetical protein